jgi:hypothetical protein
MRAPIPFAAGKGHIRLNDDSKDTQNLTESQGWGIFKTVFNLKSIELRDFIEMGLDKTAEPDIGINETPNQFKRREWMRIILILE